MTFITKWRANILNQIGLKYYDDLQTRMPREEAAQIYDEIKAAGG